MNNIKTSSKVTLRLNPEFASEIVLGVPYAYWLQQRGLLEKVETSKGMKPFYYFCDNVDECFTSRTLDNHQAGLDNLPNNWVHHNAIKVFGKPHHELSPNQQKEANGVLDYNQWAPPPYKEIYGGKDYGIKKPYVVINNTYNIEFGRTNERPYRSFDMSSLYWMFSYFQEIGYEVVYKRPTNKEFTIDQNEQQTLDLGMDLLAEIEGEGIINDHKLCDYFPNVHLIDNLITKDYNTSQLEIFSEAEGFITINGGGGILCAYFNKPVIIYVPDGKEKRPGYLTNGKSYIKMLSNASIYPIFDNPKETGVSNYEGVCKKIQEIFK